MTPNHPAALPFEKRKDVIGVSRPATNKELHIALYFQHMPPYAGAAALRGASIAVALARRASERNPRVCVFTSVPTPEKIDGIEIRTVRAREVENSASILKRIIGEIFLGVALVWDLCSRSRRWDLIVVSTPAYLPALISCAAARVFRVPYVLELRDIYPAVYTEAGLLQRGSLLDRLFTSWSVSMYQGAELVVTATKGLAKAVKDAAPHADVAHVYNGFPSRFLNRRSEKRARFTVCFHGVMGFFQDIDLLLEVAALLEPEGVEMLIIGYGHKAARVSAIASRNVRFLGRLPFDRTIDEVETCHVGLCFRCDDDVSRDSFPVKVWEYLGLGIPVIVFPKCEASDFVTQHGCGFELPVRDAPLAARLVLSLRDDQQRHREMVRRCRDIGANFTRETTGKDVADLIYEKALVLRRARE